MHEGADFHGRVFELIDAAMARTWTAG